MEKMFADIPHEGGELSEDEEKVENPSGSQPEKDEKESPSQKGEKEKVESDEKKDSKKPDNTSDEDEDKIPFHKHPRFKELVQERNELREMVEELSNKVDERFSEIKKESGKSEEIPAWFSRLYGDDPGVYAEYAKADKERREEIKAEIREEFEEKRKKDEEEIEKNNKWVKESIQSLKDEGYKFEKNELLKIMVDYQPTDENGNLDFKKGLKLLEKLNEKGIDKKKEEKKKIADNSGSLGSLSGEPNNEGVKTWAQTRKEGW